jgi:hypothetical protein
MEIMPNLIPLTMDIIPFDIGSINITKPIKFDNTPVSNLLEEIQHC